MIPCLFDSHPFNNFTLFNPALWAQTHIYWVGDAIQPSILCHPFSSCFQSFPASGSFQMTQLFASGGQSIGVSASTSVLPKNIQEWFPLGLTGWISLQSKGLSRVFSSTTVWKHQFFGAQSSLWSNSHILKKLSRPCLGVTPRDSDWLGVEWGQVTLLCRHQQWELHNTWLATWCPCWGWTPSAWFLAHALPWHLLCWPKETEQMRMLLLVCHWVVYFWQARI